MLVRTKRQILIFSSTTAILLLIYVSYEQNNTPIFLKETDYPVEKDCIIPPLELWPADLNQSTNQSKDSLDCAFNGLRFVIEKARGNVDTNSLLPKRAWLDHGVLKISPQSDRFKCDAFPIHRLDEYRSVYSDPLVDVKSGQFLPHPQVMLLCQPRLNLSQWNADLLLTQRRFYLCGSDAVLSCKHNINTSALNILLLGVDSLSRLAWHRYMPQTMKKFTDLAQTRGAIFEKYHIVGDGTTSNLLALLTGFIEEELPESRRFASRIHEGREGLIEISMTRDKEYKGSDSTPLDNFPWIWEEYKSKAGYVTHYIEDTPNWGTFQYRLQGFGNLKPPVDSYGRPCMVAASQDEARYGKKLGCTASTPVHQVLLESLREFFNVNSHCPRFSLTFLSEMIHEDPSKARYVDGDVADLLDQIDREDARGWGSFANTLVVLFSDHGPRMGRARLSLQGKLEERLPMLAILLPRKFLRDWSEAVSILKSNADRLCSPFDFHATLVHLLNQSVNQSTRGRSLLSPLPLQRTCDEAGIARHWCACAHWVTLTPDPTGHWSDEVLQATDTALETINAATRVLFTREGLRLAGVCEHLELHEIMSAEVSHLPREVIRFKGTVDRDGRIPRFEKWNAVQPSASAIRVHFRVKPKNAYFEVLLYRDSCTGAFHAPTLENIWRLDEFEEHAKCLEPHRWSHARRLCICR